MQAELPFVSVVDNLLCIIKRESKSTLVLDASALFVDNSEMRRGIVQVKCPQEENDIGIYDKR